MPRRTESTRRITAAKLICGSSRVMPYSADARAEWAMCADLRSVLLGTQPVQVQSPPSRLDSISAVRAPNDAAIPAATSPAAPPPITVMSKSGCIRTVQVRRSQVPGGSQKIPSRMREVTAGGGEAVHEADHAV